MRLYAGFPWKIMKPYHDYDGYPRAPDYKEMLAEIIELEEEFAALPD